MMNKRKLKKKFKKFLKKHSALVAYKKNIEAEGLIVETAVARFRECPHLLILGDFDWEESDEGFEYWEDLLIKWQGELRGGSGE